MRPLKAYIDLSALTFNLKLVKKIAKDCKVMAVLKANAYGHGLIESVKAIKSAEGIAILTIEEAFKIRKAGFKNTILLLEGLFAAEDIHQAEKLNINIVIHNDQQMDYLSDVTLKNSINVHLKINTGMNRLGFHINNVEKLNEKVSVNNILFIMSHLSSSDDKDTKECKLQLSKLKKINKYFKKPMSIANSAGIFLGKPFYLDYVRPGKSLYGINPFINKTFGLKPAMSIYAPILQVSNLKKGKTIGYSKTYRANREMKVATIDFGYSDGYLRSGSNKGKFFINNISCNILGRVSMDLITIDVSQLKDDQLYIGKPVEILGQNQTYADLAYETKTNEHEILISLGKNSKKVYI